MRRGCETKENYYVVNFAKRNHVKKPCQNLIYNFVHHLKYRERERDFRAGIMANPNCAQKNFRESYAIL